MSETKSIQVPEKLHTKLKRVALDRNTTIIALVSEWIATLKLGKAA